MKVGKVRTGEKFVLDDRGGVWEKIGDGEQGAIRARCFFGPRGVFGSEIQIDPRAYCYVIFEGQGQGQEESEQKMPVTLFSEQKMPASVPSDGTGMVVRILDEDEDVVIQEIVNPTTSQVAALSSVETLRMIPAGKKRVRTYHVSDFGYDLHENALCFMVKAENMEEQDDDGKDRDRVRKPARRDADTPAPSKGQARDSISYEDGAVPGEHPPVSPAEAKG